MNLIEMTCFINIAIIRNYDICINEFVFNLRISNKSMNMCFC